MEIRPILLSLKRNKAMAFLIIVQVALTLGVLSSSIFVSMMTLKEWNLPSGIPHNDIIRIAPVFFDESIDAGEAHHRDIERVKQLPGVVDITPTNVVPFAAENVSRVYLSADEEAQENLTNVFEADTTIFNVLDLKLIDGRWLNEQDVVRVDASSTERPAVVMISEQMSEALFAEGSAVGQTVWLSKGDDPVKVVGVYSNFMNGERLNGRGQSYRTIIRPLVRWGAGVRNNYLIRMEEGTAASRLDDVLNTFYQQTGRYITVSERLKRTQKRMYDGRGSRALTMLVISFVLLVITALGMTGLTSFQVSQKRKQIGTRRALGAKKSDIMRYFLLESSIVTFIGIFIGIFVTLTITFDISEEVGVNVLNLGVLAMTAALLWLVNMLAVWFPAKQAANIAPAIVTRSA